MMMSAAPAQQMPPGFSNQTNMQPQASGGKNNGPTGGASIHGNSSNFIRGNTDPQQRWS